MTSAGIRELKAKLSEYLRRVADGDVVEVTDRGRVVARLVPARDPVQEELWNLVRHGVAHWSGGRPELPPLLSELPGAPLSEVVDGGRGPR